MSKVTEIFPVGSNGSKQSAENIES